MIRTPLRPALSLLLTGILAACSQTPTPTAEDILPPGSPYANGASYPWSDRLEEPVADPYAAGRDYPWSSPQASSDLSAQGLDAGVNVLSDLPWTSASNFWGPVARDRSNGEQDVNDGHTLTIGGTTFARGLGVHADSTIKYALNAQCSTFTASIGIDDEVGKLGRATFQVLGDGKVLYTSAELTGTESAKAVNVPVAGVKELTLNVLKGANTYYDHADWADAKVTCQTLKPSGKVYVSDLAYTSATSGWGPVEIDRSNGEQRQFDGKPLTIARQVYSKGLGVHSDSALTYDLGGACQSFIATVGVDDETQGRGSVIFQVFGDGRKLYDSGVLEGYNSPQTIARADVTGVQQLKLVVTDAGDGKSFDHADWADAQLRCGPAGAPGNLDSAFGTQGHAKVGGIDSVVQPDNSVVLLGADFSVKRLSAAGTADGTGTVAVPGGTAYALARQSNGNLVVVGDQNDAVVVVHYLPTLQPDPGFGVGGVKVVQLGDVVQIGSPGQYTDVAPQSLARDVAVQADGKIVIVGSALTRYYNTNNEQYQSSLDYMVARLNTDGTRDTSFGTGGTFSLGTLAAGYNCNDVDLTDILFRVALQSDGKIVAVGNSNCAGGYVPLILRLGTTGQLDTTFSGDGLTFASIVNGGYGDLIQALVIQPDGRIVIGGATARFQVESFVERLTTGGASDGGMTFQIADNFFEAGVVTSLALQGDGRVVFGASSTNGIGLGRLNADLTLDTSFGSLGTGYVVLDQAVTSVHVDTAGRIVGSGATDTVRVLP
ncbi:NPCBM/NEW2 domain-containing protein [Deinococcus sp.]|uniref:NPCBM/NEW2 domain-containing protein n=1 Tax=Deinococcus sp. TaxID=47478 RepID=UPI0028698C12|nr:NPCBM/NEW2 domain-containing protein [Deinococcus sp.]